MHGNKGLQWFSSSVLFLHFFNIPLLSLTVNSVKIVI